MAKTKGPMQEMSQNWGVLLGLIGMAIIAFLAAPMFITSRNILNLLFQASVLALLAIGESCVILTGGIDLSVASVMALSSTIGIGGMVWYGWSVPLGIAVTLVVGLILGIMNGLGVTKLRIPPLIMTLAMMVGARGGVLLYTGGADIIGVPGAITSLITQGFGPIKYSVIIVIIAYIVFHFFLSSTKMGRYIYAVGGNESVSRFSGINVSRVKLLAYALSGVMASIAGIILTAKLFIVSPRAGIGEELVIIAAVVIGGISLKGGIGNMWGVFMGVLILSIISNMCDLKGLPPRYVPLVTGFAIFTAASLDSLRRKQISLSFLKHKLRVGKIKHIIANTISKNTPAR